MVFQKRKKTSYIPNFLFLGLTEAARNDYTLMRDVAVHTRIAPDGRVTRLLTFMESLKK